MGLFGGSSKKSYSTTTVMDKRQVAEGEIIAGPDSMLALPYSVQLGPGAKMEVTGDSSGTVGQLVSNMDSRMGRMLDLNQQLAGGILETRPALRALTGEVQQAAIIGTDTRSIMLVVVGIGLLFFLSRR